MNTAPMPDPVAPSPGPRRRLRAVAWGAAAAATIAQVALGAVRWPSVIGPELTALLLLWSLLALLGVLVAAGMLVAAYRDFFRRPGGWLLWVGVLLLTFYVENNPAVTARLGAAAGVIGLWNLAAGLALGPSLALALVRRDFSVSLLALLLLLAVAGLFTMGQALGWPELLVRIMSVEPGQALWLWQAFSCVGTWIVILGVTAFLGHTLVSLQRERQGVGSVPSFNSSQRVGERESFAGQDRATERSPSPASNIQE